MYYWFDFSWFLFDYKFDFILNYEGKILNNMSPFLITCERIDEIGSYDIPACIDYIIRESASEKLIYVGHSMGCTVFYMAMMKHASLNDRIELMISLAPATSMANLKSPAKVFAPHVSTIQVP